MNILILTSTSARHAYFATQIIEAFPEGNVRVALEEKSKKRTLRQQHRYFFRYKHKWSLFRNIFLNIVFRGAKNRLASEKVRVEREAFGEVAKRFETQYQDKILFRVAGESRINSRTYVDQIVSFAPDVIVVMGTGLIKEPIIQASRLGIINIHTGLSPYYRGGRTNLWPILAGEPGFCGVTVHTLDVGIDSGEIIYHGVPTIDEQDTYPTINTKAIKIGTALMIQAIRDKQNGTLKSIKQWDHGKLFFNRDYNGYKAFQYFRAMKRGVVKQFVRDKKSGKAQIPSRLNLLGD